MRYIIKAVDRPVGAPENFIYVVVFCKYCVFDAYHHTLFLAYLNVYFYKNRVKSQELRTVYNLPMSVRLVNTA